MNVPLHIMGLILPIYTITDMFETAVNVWKVMHTYVECAQISGIGSNVLD